MIEVVLFDADGVVLHTPRRMSEIMVEDWGVSLVQQQQFFGDPFYRCVIGQADLREELAKHLKTWDLDKSVDQIMEFWFSREAFIDDNVLAAVKRLKQLALQVTLATNQEKYRLAYMRDQLKLGDLFDPIYASFSMGIKKPQRGYFEYIWNDLGQIDKNSILFWDDSIENVKAARTFGFRAERYTTYERFERICRNSYHLAI